MEVAATPVMDVFRVVRQGWLIIVVCVVLGVGGALAASQVIPQKYEATAVLRVASLTGSSNNVVDMETERVVAGSTSVLSKAAAALGDPSADIQDAVVVTIPKGSSVLEFTYTASSPAAASDGANAVANAYSDQRVESAQQAFDDTNENLSKRIAELEKQLAGESPGSVAARAVELQIASLQERQAASVSTTFSAGTLVSAATPPTSPAGLGTLVYLAAGFSLGFLVGLLLALIRYRVRLERKAEMLAMQSEAARFAQGSETGGGRTRGAHALGADPAARKTDYSKGSVASGQPRQPHNDSERTDLVGLNGNPSVEDNGSLRLGLKRKPATDM